MKVHLLFALTLLIAACSTVDSASIDGVKVGGRRCTGILPPDDWEAAQCNRFRTFGLAAFELIHPSHTPITGTDIYRDPEFEKHDKMYSGYADFAYVVVRQAGGDATALHVRAGAGTGANICFLLPRPPVGPELANGDCLGDVHKVPYTASPTQSSG